MAYTHIRDRITISAKPKDIFFNAKSLKELKKAGESFGKTEVQNKIDLLKEMQVDTNKTSQEQYFIAMALAELESIDEPISSGGSGSTTNNITNNETVVVDKSVPVGTILAHYSTVVPDGWLECNGANVSRTEYTDLFVVIGTTAGNGDGSTTFTLPDLRGSFLRGYGQSGGATLNPNWGDSGRTIGSAQDDVYKGHSHGLRALRFPTTTQLEGPGFEYNPGNSSAGGIVVYKNRYFGMSYGWTEQDDVPAGTTTHIGDTETRPKNIAVNYIIKAKSNIDAEQGGVIGGGVQYKTDETQIGTWINGDKLYRKVFFVNQIPDGTSLKIPESEIYGLKKVTNLEYIEEENNSNVFYTSERQNIPQKEIELTVDCQIYYTINDHWLSPYTPVIDSSWNNRKAHFYKGSEYMGLYKFNTWSPNERAPQGIIRFDGNNRLDTSGQISSSMNVNGIAMKIVFVDSTINIHYKKEESGSDNGIHISTNEKAAWYNSSCHVIIEYTKQG